MKKWLKKFKNERGLTLVELLAVIVILAIVAVIAFVMIGNIIDNSRKDSHIANAQQLIASAKLYEADGGQIGKEGVNNSTLEQGGFLDKLIDPWDSKNKNYQGTVKKVNHEYKVTITGQKGECNISEEDEKSLAGDREEVCK